MSGREHPEREEDNQKTKCSSKALGLAVAAGVGIGAALYFYCNRRPQGPDTSGATTSGWTCERANQLQQENSLKALKEAAFRRRSWTLEECSICFEVMLVDQELMALQCTHNFHAQCILPWLQEKQTCPVCRENAD